MPLHSDLLTRFSRNILKNRIAPFAWISRAVRWHVQGQRPKDYRYFKKRFRSQRKMTHNFMPNFWDITPKPY